MKAPTVYAPPAPQRSVDLRLSRIERVLGIPFEDLLNEGICKVKIFVCSCMGHARKKPV